MADWYGHARSNYFRVKDQNAFADLCEKWNVTFVTDKNNPELVGFICESDFGNLPNYRCEEHEDIKGEIRKFEYDFDDFLEDLTKHLEENEVAIMIECGAEIIEILDSVITDGRCQRKDNCIVCGDKLEYIKPSVQLTIGIEEYGCPIRIDICVTCIEDWYKEIVKRTEKYI